MSSPPDSRRNPSDLTLVTREILGRVCEEFRKARLAGTAPVIDEPVLAEYLELRISQMLLSLDLNGIHELVIRSWTDTLRMTLFLTAATLRAGYVELLSDFMPVEREDLSTSPPAEAIDPDDIPY